MIAAAASATATSPSQDAMPAIVARGIGKTFFGTAALEGVDFTVARGEVHGLVGKNGAGKSTFLKILSGAQPPDSGTIMLGGRTFRALNPVEAYAAGIAVVYQNPELHPDLTVAANIFLGAEQRARFGLIDDRAMFREAAALVARLGLALPVESRLGDLDIADRQQVAIAKAVREKATVLLLDEPTAALNKAQTEFLFRLIRNLSAGGMAIVYISHHLDEVLAVSDRVSVLRNGRLVGVVDAATIDKERLIAMIVGGAVEKAPIERRAPAGGTPYLTLRSLHLPGQLVDASLDLARGEILGLTGLAGAGAGAIAAIIAGTEPGYAGAMTLGGEPYAPRTVRDAVRRGVAYVPEEMRTRGLAMFLSTAANMTLAGLGSLATAGWLDLKRERASATALIGQFGLVPPDPEREVRFLSGGNQRKALLGRAVFANAGLLVLEEPTQGVDVEARRQIHERLRSLAAAGTSIVFVSTDLDELIVVADRIVVLRSGRIGDELQPAGLTPERLLAAIQSSVPEGQGGE